MHSQLLLARVCYELTNGVLKCRMQKSTPLHWAALNGHTSAARVLLEHNADTSAKDGKGRTALGIATRKNRAALRELLEEEQRRLAQ
mmetsp:Transcript_2036/g.5624  ORF Transcript_2036/g.5624 Transcript_2036/m.5624 type:complete len:87 (+) Transcript_2036:377-637(+)